MSIVNGSLQVGRRTTAQIAAATSIFPLAGQLVVNTDDGKYCIGDGTTALSALTFYGGVSASGLTINSTTITSGTDTRILYNNAGVVGEYLVTGTGTTAVLSTSPTFNTSIDLTGSGAIVTFNDGTSKMIWRAIPSIPSYSGIFLNQTPSSTNAALYGDGSLNTFVNGGTSVYISNGTSNVARFGFNYALFTPQNQGAGTSIPFNIAPVNATNGSSTIEIPTFKISSYSRTWATGGITTQRNFWIASQTLAFAGASTITNAYSLYIEAATAGTNATITNNYAAGFSGNVNIIGTPYISGVAGVDGTFTTVDGKTVTVSKGLITSIV